MNEPTIASLTRLAREGDTAAMCALMVLAVKGNTFLSRCAARALWENFRIRAEAA